MLAFVMIASLLQIPTEGCSLEALQALAHARERRERAGAAEAGSPLMLAIRESPHCVPVGVARWAIAGWTGARAAAPKGGAPDALGPAKAALDALTALTERSSWRVQNDYARAAITAAIAAAQDERPEMGVYLTHARGLSDRLALANERAEWPLPIDELEGELWLEVDRYAEARDAYYRAVKVRGGPSALVGLARVSDRLRAEGGACEAYRQALEGAQGSLAEEARRYLNRPVCGR
jgi:hypothetical protein